MYDSYQALDIKQNGAILTITIDNPPMNAVNPRIHGELSRIFTDINNDPSVAVVIVTGAGDRAFSAGGDLKAMADRIANADHARWRATIAEGRAIVLGALDLKCPLIARVNGHAMGLGSTLAVLADFSYMIGKAKIADTHVKVGLSAGDGGSILWPLLMGFPRARKHLLTGDMLTGDQAAEYGLISEAVPDAAALDEAVNSMAERLASGATVAVNATKMSINKLLRPFVVGMIDEHLALETQTYLTRDHGEAVSAFLEERPPRFEGR